MIAFYIVLVFFWSISRYCDLSFMAVSSDSPWWTFFSYSFCHVNIFHLFVNCWAIASIYKSLRHLKSHALAIAVFFVPFAAALACRLLMSFNPTIGASAIVFGFLGIFIAEYDIVRPFRVYSSIALSLIVPFLFPQINAVMHAFSFAFGFFYGKLYHVVWLHFNK